MQMIQRIALALVIIGALNWGLVGFFQFDVVAQLTGGTVQPLARFIYIVIGISGLINLSLLFENWREREVTTVKNTEPKEI